MKTKIILITSSILSILIFCISCKKNPKEPEIEYKSTQQQIDTNLINNRFITIDFTSYNGQPTGVIQGDTLFIFNENQNKTDLYLIDLNKEVKLYWPKNTNLTSFGVSNYNNIYLRVTYYNESGLIRDSIITSGYIGATYIITIH